MLAGSAFWVALLFTASAAVAARPPGAEQILRKAEQVRNPNLDYAVDFTIHGVSRGAEVRERDASYSMLASGKDRTVILMRTPESLYGALMLMAENRYWMLLPRATKPWELNGAQMMNGDVATGDLARANLTRGYTVSLSGEERVDGEACWRLELRDDGVAARYPRIVYWVAKGAFLPRKLEFYGLKGGLLKSVRYGDYRKGALGVRPMRLEIESFDEWKEAATLSFAKLRRVKPGPGSFTPEGMIALRDAALGTRGAAGPDDVSLERMLRAVASHPGLE